MQGMDELYNEHFQTVYRYIFCLTHDADLSEEITQEAFYQALKTLKNFRGDCKISVWFCQIAKYIWINEYKRRNRYDCNSIDDYADTLPSNQNIEDEILDIENKVTLYRKLQTLDEKTREVMYLRLTGELSFREIGDILKKNETWARVTYYRGKQRLVKEGLD
jgi:RNA polymerase sigma-70 factor (ECF subfamily)